jgi:dihydrofolate synthase/folylpolyglutamate synthase
VKRPARRGPPARTSYASTLRYLYGLQYRGIKAGLKNIRHLVAFAGHPERSYPVFHVAGTNGKGSTSSFLASILTASGYRTGLYTSPHLIDFVERVRIDGQPMPEPELVEYVRRLRPAIEETQSTFFEATTCVAFQYFADHGVDVAVIETGLGGRLDATNVVLPLASIITNIGLDHQEILGNTIAKIAREKAGIIKEGAPVVTAARGEALDVIRSAARNRRTTVHVSGRVASLRPAAVHSGRFVVDVNAGSLKMKDVLLGLSGEHQVSNAALAVSALALARRKDLFPEVTADAVRRGLGSVTELAGLRCRMERILRPGAVVTIDVAHNPDGVRTAVGPFAARHVPYFDAVVFGAMKDKDYGGMLAILGRVARTVVAVRPRTPRAAAVRDLLRAGRTLGIRVEAGGSVEAGLRRAMSSRRRERSPRKSRILVIGSHFVAGEALLAFEKTP